MKRAENLKEFIRYIIAFIGTGYTNYKLVEIPPKKANKKEIIIRKLSDTYQTNLTRSQRAYAKSKGKANFNGVAFNNILFICFTNGSISNEIDLGNGIGRFEEKNSLSIRLSDYTTINIFIDERKKITAKMSKETFRDIKNQLQDCFNQKNGYLFHNVLKKVSGFPNYRGFQLQKRDLVFFCNEQKKIHGVGWNIGRI